MVVIVQMMYMPISWLLSISNKFVICNLYAHTHKHRTTNQMRVEPGTSGADYRHQQNPNTGADYRSRVVLSGWVHGLNITYQRLPVSNVPLREEHDYLTRLLSKNLQLPPTTGIYRLSK